MFTFKQSPERALRTVVQSSTDDASSKPADAPPCAAEEVRNALKNFVAATPWQLRAHATRATAAALAALALHDPVASGRGTRSQTHDLQLEGLNDEDADTVLGARERVLVGLRDPGLRPRLASAAVLDVMFR
jgi:hypothetical protein